MVAKKRGLGRGLDALLGSSSRREEIPSTGSDAKKSGLEEVPVEWIRPGKYQPRTYFEPESLSELASSIKSQGVMQPIVLRMLEPDRYEIIAGERRWRAAQQAGLEKIPAIIRTVNDESAVAMSLIENIQREDLNPLEEARALNRLIEEFQLTHMEVAEAVGKSRSAVTNTLRLIHLAEPVALMLENGEIEMGHARTLLTLDRERQLDIARQIVDRELNVRQTEALVRKLSQPDLGAKKSVTDPDTSRLEQNLGSLLGQTVQIRHTSKGKGKLVINYNSLDELDGILGRMGYEE